MWHIINGILLSHKKKDILPFVTTWMEHEDIMFSKNKPDRKRQIMYVIRYMPNLKEREREGNKKKRKERRKERGNF